MDTFKKEEASIIYKIDEIYYGLAPKIREMSNEYQKTKDEYILMEVWSQYADCKDGFRLIVIQRGISY